MDIQKSKIALAKIILAINNIEIVEKVAFFINNELENNFQLDVSSNYCEETEKGMETIIRMVGEFK